MLTIYILYLQPRSNSFPLLLCFPADASTHLPGQAVSSVAVDLPLTDGSDGQTLPPPQLLVLFDDVMPQLAGPRGAAQTLCIQLAEDLHAHLWRQRLCKVLRGSVTAGNQGGSSSTEEKHGRGPREVMLHNNSNSWKQPANRRIQRKEKVKQTADHCFSFSVANIG